MAIYLTKKLLGETPLEALEKIRDKKKIPKNTPMTYAGRLDPAATGLLLILSDKDVKNKEKYTQLPKIYEIEILFGIKTDTGDILGIPSIKNFPKKIGRLEIKNISKKLIGKRKQKYHSFSSKNINGKPLWKISRKKKIKKLPEHEIEIKKIQIINESKVEAKKIVSKLKKIVSKLKTDFRQNKILKAWEKIDDTKSYQIFKLKIESSSGAYMRVLSEEMGEKLKEKCLCFSINRIKIGKFNS